MVKGTGLMEGQRALPALSIMQPNITDDFGNWLAGFIDGEGCFYFHSRRKQFSPPQFQLKLRDDDRGVIEECVSQTGIGAVIEIPRRDCSHSQIKWLVSKCSDCCKLIDILDKYPLRAKKKRDFAIWKEAVLLWSEQKKLGISGGGTQKYAQTKRIKELQVELKGVRAYVRS